jgi:glycerol dehydrogenase
VVVAHSPSGQVLDLIELSSAPDLCIADFELLRSAPARTLRAGMADTLAKWLEWSAVGEIEGPGAAEARQAYDIVMEASPSDEKIWEANLRLSALASNQGDAPAAAAHSFCAGISMMPASRQWLHGEWVGLGLLFQQQLCGDTDTDQGRLKEWLKGLGLPTALPFTLEDPGMIAERIAQNDESIWQMARAQDLGIGSIRAALGSLSR